MPEVAGCIFGVQQGGCQVCSAGTQLPLSCSMGGSLLLAAKIATWCSMGLHQAQVSFSTPGCQGWLCCSRSPWLHT